MSSNGPSVQSFLGELQEKLTTYRKRDGWGARALESGGFRLFRQGVPVLSVLEVDGDARCVFPGSVNQSEVNAQLFAAGIRIIPTDRGHCKAHIGHKWYHIVVSSSGEWSYLAPETWSRNADHLVHVASVDELCNAIAAILNRETAVQSWKRAIRRLIGPGHARLEMPEWSIRPTMYFLEVELWVRDPEYRQAKIGYRSWKGLFDVIGSGEDRSVITDGFRQRGIIVETLPDRFQINLSVEGWSAPLVWDIRLRDGQWQLDLVP